ncbi:DUF1697 domain-containing protein [Actibacterium sp. D379-3]
MTVWVALLRGVNVGGAHKLPMPELRALLTAQGFGDVASYIQSGNLVFTAGDTTAGALAARIGAVVEAGFGFRPQVVVLHAAALEHALTNAPFPEADPARLHLLFLDPPMPLDLSPFTAVAAPGKRLEQHGGVLYLQTPNGFGRSKLAQRLLSQPAKGVTTTARNLRSCRQIAELARAVG